MRGVFFILFFISFGALAAPHCPDSTNWIISRPQDLTENLVETKSSQKIDFNNLKVLVWNIYKGSKPGFYSDLNYLIKDIDLALLQEGYLDQTFKNLFCSRQDLNWKLAKSFTDLSGVLTGVVTASKQNPLDFFALKSHNTEPVTYTSKTILVTYYEISGSSETVLALNIHGLNFVTMASYKNQIGEALELIKKHSGPVIFGGDFNTHLDERLTYLKEELGSLGVEHVELSGNEYNSFLTLDHMFLRGFEVIKSETLKHVSTSDHKPLYFELKLK